MKKLFSFALVAAVAMLFVGCNGYDDSDLQRRVKALEDSYLTLNTNVSTMSQTLNALTEGDVVTNVAPINEGGKVVGYTVTFKKAGSITILNGQDGAPGSTPRVSAAKDTDGKYYWKVDDEWLKDASGNKIPATGSDGVTPQFKIEDGFWYVNVGSGWTKLGQATGDKGENGDSFFSSVSETADAVIITLADGTVYELPKEKQFKFTTVSYYWPVFDNIDNFVNDTYDLNFTLEGAEGDENLVVISSTGNTRTAVNWNDDKSGGFIRITNPINMHISDDSYNYTRGSDVLSIIFSDDAGHSSARTFYVPYRSLEVMFSNNYNGDDEVDLNFSNQAAEEDMYLTYAVVFDKKYGDYNAGATFQLSEAKFNELITLKFEGVSNPFATMSYVGNYATNSSLHDNIFYYYAYCDYHYNIPKNTTGANRYCYFSVSFKLPPLPPQTNNRTHSFSSGVNQYK